MQKIIILDSQVVENQIENKSEKNPIWWKKTMNLNPSMMLMMINHYLDWSMIYLLPLGYRYDRNKISIICTQILGILIMI